MDKRQNNSGRGTRKGSLVSVEHSPTRSKLFLVRPRTLTRLLRALDDAWRSICKSLPGNEMLTDVERPPDADLCPHWLLVRRFATNGLAHFHPSKSPPRIMGSSRKASICIPEARRVRKYTIIVPLLETLVNVVKG